MLGSRLQMLYKSRNSLLSLPSRTFSSLFSNQKSIPDRDDVRKRRIAVYDYIVCLDEEIELVCKSPPRLSLPFPGGELLSDKFRFFFQKRESAEFTLQVSRSSLSILCYFLYYLCCHQSSRRLRSGNLSEIGYLANLAQRSQFVLPASISDHIVRRRLTFRLWCDSGPLQ